MKKLVLALFIIFGISNLGNAQDVVWQNILNTGTLNKSCIDEKGNTISISLLNNDSLLLNEASTGITKHSFNTDWKNNFIINKIDSNGNSLWVKQLSIGTKNRVDLNSIYSHKGGIYIAISGTPPQKKLDSIFFKISLTSSTDTTITVINDNDYSYSNTAIIKLNADGSFSWLTHYDFAEIGTYDNNMLFDNKDIRFIIPHYLGGGALNILMDTNGILKDTFDYQSSLGVMFSANQLNNSTSYITREASGDFSICKYDKNHNKISSYVFDKTMIINSGSLCIDEDNNIYYAERFQGSGSILGKQLTDDLSAIVVKLDSNLNPKWVLPVNLIVNGNNENFPALSISFNDNKLSLAASSSNGKSALEINDVKLSENQNSHLVNISPSGNILNYYHLNNNLYDLNLSKNPFHNGGLSYTAAIKDSAFANGEMHYFSGSRYLIGKYGVHNNTIKGKVYIDDNKDTVFNNSEIGVKNHLIHLDNNTTSVTGSNGDYTALVGTGTTTLTTNSVKYYNVVPSTKEITFNSNNNVTTQDFALQAIGNINDLEVYLTNINNARPGRVVIYRLTAKNTGTTTLNTTLTLSYDDSLNFNSAGPAVDNHTGNVLTWNIANLAPFETKHYTVTFTAKTTLTFNDTLCNSAKITPILGDTTPENNVDTLYQEVRASYDPNIKETSRSEIIDVTTVNGSFPIDYTIHFQNTGNDTAFHVYLIDSLDTDLKVESIEVLSASHDYEMSISENNTLRWDYYNILLVDSNTNEPMSHGFVKYRVWTKDNPGLGDEFTNFADIYFDFNEPVRTNTTSNRIDKIESVELVKGKTVIVYPNPSNGVFTVKADIKAGTKTKVEVIDLTGKLVSTQNVVADANGLETPIDINTLPQGIYFVKVYANNEVYTAKVIKQ